MRLLFFLIIPIISFSQEDNYNQLIMLSNVEFEKAVSDSILKLGSLDLWNFLKALKDDYNTDLKPFNKILTLKFETSKGPNELYFLLTFLIKHNTDTSLIEKILNNRKEIWDSGQWGEKFWKVIRENNLKIKEGIYYSVNEKGQKTYKIKMLLEVKTRDNVLGSNPLLFLDYDLKSYPENGLIEILEKLSIKDVEIISKEEGPKLFGKRGQDGGIKILTSTSNF